MFSSMSGARRKNREGPLYSPLGFESQRLKLRGEEGGVLRIDDNDRSLKNV
jgi:hypothetical protein